MIIRITLKKHTKHIIPIDVAYTTFWVPYLLSSISISILSILILALVTILILSMMMNLVIFWSGIVNVLHLEYTVMGATV